MTRLTRVITGANRERPLPEVDMSTRLANVTFPGPVMTASGCAGYGRELDQFFDITTIGAIVTKSIMVNPRSGRPTPRMAETPSGMLNSIGLQGPGIDQFIERDLAWLEKRGARVVVSIAGSATAEYVKLAQRLRHAPAVSAIEVNISCPNVEERGLVFACDPSASATVVEGVRRNVGSGVPVFAKLSPDVTDIVSIARACVDAGADGLSMINTMLGVVIDTETMRPHLGGVTGGLSGPAIRPVAVRAVWQVHAAMPEVPLIGMGGIKSGQDALEFLAAGASAVQVGTVIFNDPVAPARISSELQRLLADRGFGSCAEVVGAAHQTGQPSEVEAPTASASAGGVENTGGAAG
jgi:dihydroorotate dehydrogenase (NAD+) catalytic subunit